MSGDEFKCYYCKTIPDCKEVFKCARGHISCLPCGNKHESICFKCRRVFVERVKNPALKKTKPKPPTLENCVFQKTGCTWKFLPGIDMHNHTKECKYRKYKCLGQRLNVWNCAWEGEQKDLVSHFRKAHGDSGKAFSYFTTESIPFNAVLTYSRIRLVNAFSKDFLLYFSTNCSTNMVYFLIFAIGRKEEARQYLYEFEIKSPIEKFRKIKFVEECASDSVELQQIIEANQCVTITHNCIKSYLHDDYIHFRFIVKKKDQIGEKSSEKTANAPSSSSSNNSSSSSQSSSNDSSPVLMPRPSLSDTYTW